MLREDLFRGLPYNYEATAIDVANISGQNRVRGIHSIKNREGEIEAAVILCTLNGEKYANEWIYEGNVLKYYFNGITIKGTKRFSPDYADNQVIFRSVNNYPIFTFVRDRGDSEFKYKGKFSLLESGTETNGAMYFVLIHEEYENSYNVVNVPIEDNENFPEGREKERLHKYKERNPKVIKEAKERFKREKGRLYCEICEFDFQERYGELGDDYIEGHHTVPVSELEGNSVTNVNDILLVCCNCHRMLHKKRPCLSKEELKNIIIKNNN